MKGLLFILPLIVFGMGLAYAEPLGDIQTTVLDYSNSTATVQITWNEDSSASSYQVGCVSCFPNTVDSTSDILHLEDTVGGLPDIKYSCKNGDFGITSPNTTTINLGSITAGNQHEIELTYVIN